MIAKARVPSGASDQLSSGETFSPSPVCFFGMAPPASKAVLRSCILDGAKPMRSLLEDGRRRESSRDPAAPPTRSDGHVRSPKVSPLDRKSTRLNSSHVKISYAVFCLKKKTKAL